MRAFVHMWLAMAREWWRDSTALLWTVVFPVAISVGVGIIFAGSDEIVFGLGIVNEGGETGQRLIDAFKHNDTFKVTEGQRESELAALRDGKRRAVLIIPPALDDAVARYDAAQPAPPVSLSVYYDTGNQYGPVVLSAIRDVIAGMELALTGVTPLLAMDVQTVVADDVRSVDYMLIGVLAMSLMQLGLFVTAVPLVGLRERGVLRRLGVTPLRRETLLVAQVMFRLLIALGQAAVVIAIGVLAFGVQVEDSNTPAVVGMVLLGAAVFITMGFFLSGLARTEDAVQMLVGLPNAVFMLLSGIFFPVDGSPGWIRPFMDVLPLSYLGDALRQLVIGAPPTYSLAQCTLGLLVWLAACTGLALYFFRWDPQT
jgi:ABC-2 type transport system permease protein